MKLGVWSESGADRLRRAVLRADSTCTRSLVDPLVSEEKGR